MLTRRLFMRVMMGGATIAWIGCDVGAGPPKPPAGSGAGGSGGSGGSDGSGGSGGSGGTGGSGGSGGTGGSGGRMQVDAGMPDAADCGTATWYDLYAMALYMDGSLGPQTGTITAQFMTADQETTFDFWHGHNGVMHRWTVTRDHIRQLLAGQRVMITTTIVEDHNHDLFIDPADPQWRLPGAQPELVPIPCN
jgi:hypothetical protein